MTLTPLVCLHGFMDTGRTWELVLPRLRRRHEVLAPTLAGHAGGPPLERPLGDRTLADAVERAMDAAGFETAHLVGNSLGGWARAAGRHHRERCASSPPLAIHEQAKAAAPHAASLLSTPDGRRRATRYITVEYEHIPVELLEQQLLGVARCEAAVELAAYAADSSWELDAAAIDCPVRIVWGTADELLPWPSAAARYRTEWLPQADWVELEGVGHCPQLDVPLETAELILG